MNASVLRRVIAHWADDLDVAHLKAEVAAILRARDRRRRERKAANEEVLRAFQSGADDQDDR